MHQRTDRGHLRRHRGRWRNLRPCSIHRQGTDRYGLLDLRLSRRAALQQRPPLPNVVKRGPGDLTTRGLLRPSRLPGLKPDSSISSTSGARMEQPVRRSPRSASLRPISGSDYRWQRPPSASRSPHVAMSRSHRSRQIQRRDPHTTAEPGTSPGRPNGGIRPPNLAVAVGVIPTQPLSFSRRELVLSRP